jgi:hypothetical protein
MSTPVTTPNPLVLRNCLSPERLGPYLADAVPAGDLTAALLLYSWNAEISGSLFELLGHMEVVLRNAMHDQLTAWAQVQVGSANWFDQAAWFNQQTNQDIADAKARLQREGKSVTPGRLVAELNFGFWRFLLTGHYDATLWRSALVSAFPNSGGRRESVYKVVERMNRLRNRIAHHEPIHRRNHTYDHDDALWIVYWINDDARDWVEGQCRVHSVLSRKP